MGARIPNAEVDPITAFDGVDMKVRVRRALQRGLLCPLLAVWGLSIDLSGQEWTHYGGDAAGSRYSRLDQIQKSNVKRLKTAWVFDTGDFSDGAGPSPTRSSFEASPL